MHSTLYRYDQAVLLSPHALRLRPRTDGAQRVTASGIQIQPTPVGLTDCIDQDNNLVLQAWFSGLTRELHIVSTFTVDTLRTNPFDFVLTGEAVQRMPVRYTEPLRSALAPYCEVTGIGSAVRHYAALLAAEVGFQTLPFLALASERLYRTGRHVFRDDGPPLTSDVTLQHGEGSCRDFAMLFCDLCRGMGLAARFVSGYEQEAARQETAHMHAWAEVYLPGGGWRGYDPSRGVAVSTAHVAVAAAAHSDLASPVTGSYQGVARSTMEASLCLQSDALPA